MGPAGHGETNGAIAPSNAEDLEAGAAAGNSAPASKEELLQVRVWLEVVLDAGSG